MTFNGRCDFHFIAVLCRQMPTIQLFDAVWRLIFEWLHVSLQRNILQRHLFRKCPCRITSSQNSSGRWFAGFWSGHIRYISWEFVWKANHRKFPRLAQERLRSSTSRCSQPWRSCHSGCCTTVSETLRSVGRSPAVFVLEQERGRERENKREMGHSELSSALVAD